jgi:PAS domain S-box-containing protein
MGTYANKSQPGSNLSQIQGGSAESDRSSKENVLQTEEFTRAVLDSLSDHIAVLDKSGLIIAVNEAWLRFARENDCPNSQLIGAGVNYLDVCRCSSRLGDETAQVALNGIQAVLDGSRELFSIVYPCHSPAEKRWFLMNVRCLAQIYTGAVISHADITKLKQAEESLHESEERLSYVMEAATEGAFDWNVKTGKVYYSPGLIESLGYSPVEVPPHVSFWESIVHPDDMPMVHKILKEHLDGKTEIYEAENRLRKKSGEYRWNHVRGKVVKRDADGQPLRMVGIETDITGRKLKEEELQSAYAEIKLLKELAEAENIYLRDEIKFEQGFEDIVGESNAIKYVLYRATQVAPTDATVLILGETGTGKGRIAYAVHKASRRKDKPLIHVNCAALPENLIESEMFGREKGAFTGAEARQIGRFDLAHQGTIFLDEIGELSLSLQAKLLRVIEDGEFERLGSPHTIKVDVRVIASTNRNLEEEMKAGRFREDLYYRLNVFPITVPPLRQRKEDILLLTRYFAEKFARKYGLKITKIPKPTMEALHSYPWPGNVRELANVIERAVITSPGPVLRLAEKVDAPSTSAQVKDNREGTLCDVERAHILKILEETTWRIEGPSGAAQLLGINPSTLRARMKKLGIKRT